MTTDNYECKTQDMLIVRTDLPFVRTSTLHKPRCEESSVESEAITAVLLPSQDERTQFARLCGGADTSRAAAGHLVHWGGGAGRFCVVPDRVLTPCTTMVPVKSHKDFSGPLVEKEVVCMIEQEPPL